MVTAIIYLAKNGKLLGKNVSTLTLNDANHIGEDKIHIPFYKKFGFKKENYSDDTTTMILNLDDIDVIEDETGPTIRVNYK